jgi:type I restriction enzyme S subunit
MFPEPGSAYRHIGIKSWGKGVIEYPETLGSELSKVSYYTFPSGALLLSNIKAWELAVALSEPRHADFLASQRFLPYVPRDSSEVHVGYLLQFFLSDSGAALLQRASPGSADRNRTLGRKAFEALSIPLPSFPEQKRIASEIEALSALTETLAPAERAHRDLLAVMQGDLYTHIEESLPLHELVTPVVDPINVIEDDAYVTAGIRWYGEGVFVKDVKRGHEIKASRLFKLHPGHLVYNKLFAWKGSFALVPDDSHGLVASNEFPSFAINKTAVLPEYLLGWFRQPKVWEMVERLSTGGTPTSRNRLKENELLQLRVPFAPMPVQESIVTRLRLMDRMRQLRDERELLATALPQAARNRAFS